MDDLSALVKKAQDKLTEEPPFIFHYNKIARAIEEIPQAIVERIKRNEDGLNDRLKANQPFLPVIIESMALVSANTWETILFLCGQNLEHGRKVEFTASVPPLARTLADTLFTFIYIFDNPQENCRRFAVSGWGKGMIYYNRMNEAHRSDPRWQPWLDGFLASVQSTLESAPATPEETADLKTAARWPNPGKMITKSRDQARKDFLELLQDWFYAELSEDSHLSYPGLVRRSAILYRESAEMPSANPQRYRTAVFLTALAVHVALLSEIAGQLALSHEKGRLRDIWQIITANPDWSNVITLYDARYAALLQ